MKNYGLIKLTVTSPVQTLTEPITLTEAKAYLRLPDYSPADSAADALLESLISAARQQAEAMQGRPLTGAQYDLTLDCWPAGEINLAEGLSTVDLVQYKKDDGTTATLTENTDYVVDTVRGLIMPMDDDTWPVDDLWDSGAITVRYTVAPSTVDAIVKAGMYMLIALWWDDRMPVKSGVGGVYEMPYGIKQCLAWGAKTVLP